MKRHAKLRQLIREPGIIVMPGAHDAVSAWMIELVGFPVISAGAAQPSNAILGLPDLGLQTMTEMAEYIHRMAMVTTIPIIADADQGYGNAINVMRTVREFEWAGASGIFMEDQDFPKRCGHFSGKQVIPQEEMVMKIEAAIEAREDDDFVLIARTDARAVLGFDAAIERARAYVKAGADGVFVESPISLDEMRMIPKLVDAPCFANMVSGGGLSPHLTYHELEAMGYKFANYGSAAMQAAMKATYELLETIKKTGSAAAYFDRMVTFDERQRFVRLPEYKELERRFATTPTPSKESAKK